MTTKNIEKYSRKWGQVNWFRANNRIPVEFSNSYIDTEPYNERLYGPKIQIGHLQKTQNQVWQSGLNVGYGMGMTMQVNPMTDTNFRIVSYEEIESSTDLYDPQKSCVSLSPSKQ